MLLNPFSASVVMITVVFPLYCVNVKIYIDFLLLSKLAFWDKPYLVIHF